MSLYRCAACGSPNVIQQTENDGYSYKKGILGAIMFGAAGAVAGVDGGKKQVYKCPDCGLTLNAPMSLDIKQIIDLGVSSYSAEQRDLLMRPFGISWNVIKDKYKNIEEDKSVLQENPDYQEIKKNIMEVLSRSGTKALPRSDIMYQNDYLRKCDIRLVNKALIELATEEDSKIEKTVSNRMTYYRLKTQK